MLKPIVIGPQTVPRVTDVGQARRSPALVVLSTLAHPADQDVLKAAHEALSNLNPGTFTSCYRLIEAALAAAGRRFPEDLMPRTPFLSEWANKHHAAGYDEGEAKGRATGLVEGQTAGLARAVLEVVDAHRLGLSDAARQRIEECRDESQLLTWLRRAADATTAEQIFA